MGFNDLIFISIQILLLFFIGYIIFNGVVIDYDCWDKEADNICGTNVSRSIVYVEEPIFGSIKLTCNHNTFKFKSNDRCYTKLTTVIMGWFKR